jgi:hypothetical protein
LGVWFVVKLQNLFLCKRQKDHDGKIPVAISGISSGEEAERERE